MENSIEKSTANAIKWSTFAEIASKLILPIANMILARILTPSAFGIVASVNIVISFAEIFQDAGFQKYIVQHEFLDKEDFEISANVAFWTNLLISSLIWLTIFIFRNQLAEMIGNPGLGNEITIASFSLPLIAFSSIQVAFYKRSMNFKRLFWVRLITSLIPLLITVPLAILFKNYWCLIIGTIIRYIVQGIVLFYGSSWKPKFVYNIKYLIKMWSFCLWTLAESITIWLTVNAGVFVVTRILGVDAAGYYKTSMVTVTSIIGIASSATVTVLFSALSRVQNEAKMFKKIFYEFQRVVGIIIIPIGAGIFMYRELITDILLGSQWKSCSDFIGYYALVASITIITNSFFSEVYRAKGKPRVSMIAQLCYLAFLIPGLILTAKVSYNSVCMFTALSAIGFQLIHFFIARRYFDIEINKVLINIILCIIPSLVMCLVAFLLQKISITIIWQLISILLCIIVYFTSALFIPPIRNTLKNNELSKNLYSKIIEILYIIPSKAKERFGNLFS